MASIYVNIDDMRKIPGEFNASKTRWTFPEIKYIDSMNRERYWIVYVELYDSKSGAIMKVKDSYYDNAAIVGAEARIISIYGLVGGKEQTTVPTIIKTGKNLGKKNQTNAWTQALRDAVGKYNDYIKNKVLSTKDKEKAEYIKGIGKEHEELPSDIKRFPPMLMKTHRRVVVRKHKKHIVDKYELVREAGAVDVDFKEDVLYCQRKLNGVRVITHLVGDGSKKHPYEVEFYSRKLGTYPGFTTLKEQLLPILKNHPTLYLDGELYKHGMPLQQLSGIARNSEKKEYDKVLEYHIFDCFYPPSKTALATDTSIPFTEAYEILKGVLTRDYLEKNKLIKFVETTRIYSDDDMIKQLDKYLLEGYEGLMVRRAQLPYKFGYGSTRSSSTLKVKPRFEDEFVIVGFTEGEKGKDKGAIIWILVTKEGKQFNAVPKGMSYQERYDLYKKMTPTRFEKEYKGKLMTVEYEELSIDNTPLRAKAIVIRDYEPKL